MGSQLCTSAMPVQNIMTSCWQDNCRLTECIGGLENPVWVSFGGDWRSTTVMDCWRSQVSAGDVHQDSQASGTLPTLWTFGSVASLRTVGSTYGMILRLARYVDVWGKHNDQARSSGIMTLRNCFQATRRVMDSSLAITSLKWGA